MEGASSGDTQPATSLGEIAHAALVADGFTPTLGSAAAAELSVLQAGQAAHGLPESSSADVRDLRDLLWSSIDNAESRDLDQVEWVEQRDDGALRILIGIADVDSLVPRGSALDEHAFANSTSVYTGMQVYPMLPPEISTDLTSLNQGEDRRVMVIEIVIARDGAIVSHDVYPALAANRAKLDYVTVGAWLEGHGPVPPLVASTPGLEEQVWLQDRAASLLKRQREAAGALEFETIEATPSTKDGKVDGLVVTRKNRARDLIEDFMVTANVAIAQILAERGRSAIRRVVHTPKRWSRIVDIARGYGVELPAEASAKALSGFLATRRAADPTRFADLSLAVVKLLGPGEYLVDKPGPLDDKGHFGLAASDYAHATAPNRRYADLVTQRLVKAALADAPPPYTDSELEAIAKHCTERENAANHVERIVRKAAAASLLSDRVGATFDAIVTGVNREGTYVRLISPPAEGRVTRGEEGMDVGERVRVRLVSTDERKGHIDFEGVPSGSETANA
ncbi:MAG: RNB domain-containing ribonuclease [Gemmatimonadota bacterium]